MGRETGAWEKGACAGQAGRNGFSEHGDGQGARARAPTREAMVGLRGPSHDRPTRGHENGAVRRHHGPRASDCAFEAWSKVPDHARRASDHAPSARAPPRNSDGSCRRGPGSRCGARAVGGGRARPSLKGEDWALGGKSDMYQQSPRTGAPQSTAVWQVWQVA